MTTVGEILRGARENQGRAIAEVADELCITQRYLRALEEGDIGALPGVFFYKSFVRQYAALLGLDEKLIRPALDDVTNPHDAPAPPSSVVLGSSAPLSPIRALDPLVESTNRQHFGKYPIGWAVAGLALSLAACSGFYVWWSRPPQQVAAANAVQRVGTPAPAAPAVPDTAALPYAAAQPATEIINAKSEIDATTDGVGGVVLDLSATEKTWVSVTSNGRRIFSGVLQPSESKKLTADMATIKVGNAGGIEVRWNGKPIGPIGGRGEVRTVRFTPEEFQILTPSGDL